MDDILFPEGSFGHIGSTGTAFFISRKLQLYVIVLTNARRYHPEDKYPYLEYMDDFMELRTQIHACVKEDLKL